jgi:hypothetical protein
MENAKKYAYALLAVCCVLVPVLLLLLGGLAHAVPQDLAQYDYVSFVSPTGEETLYQKSYPSFQGAADAFLSAKPCETLPASYENASYMTVTWIRSGRARPYRLYLSPAAGEGYFVDDRGNAFSLTADGLIFFLREDAAEPFLKGNAPRVRLFNGSEVPVALCRWTYTVLDGIGNPVDISSGEYKNSSADEPTLRANHIFLLFDDEPKTQKYTIYSRAEIVLESETPPSVVFLPPGEYQVVLVAEWQSASVCTRAAYSFYLYR